MTTALIADDEVPLAHYLRDLLLALWPQLQIVGIARNGVEAAAEIARLQPDLAFLDLRMPGLTGLEVAQGIEGDTRVVFVTAYDDFAVQAFEQEVLDYVLKPVTESRLRRTVERLQRAVKEPPPEAALAAVLQRLQPHDAQPRLQYLRASAGEVTHHIDVDDVLFFRADDKYTCVQTPSAEHLIRASIAELASQLDPRHFWQVHRSTIVNLRHLASTRRDAGSRLFLRMKGWKGELPVSRAYVHLFRAM